jgi:hypothetical protein
LDEWIEGNKVELVEVPYDKVEGFCLRKIMLSVSRILGHAIELGLNLVYNELLREMGKEVTVLG